jgi:hypothetical protein
MQNLPTKLRSARPAWWTIECSTYFVNRLKPISNAMAIFRFVVVAVFLFAGFLSLAQGVINATAGDGSKDFQWSVARYLLEHKNPYQLFVDFRAGRLASSPFIATETPVYPASAEIFLWPLAALDYSTARWAWALLNGFFSIGCAVFLARIANLGPPVLLGLAGLFLASTPLRSTIGNGQQGLWSLFFLLAAVDCQQRDRRTLAGLFLAASWLKYTVTAPLSLIFLRRGWRTPIPIAAGLHVALTLFLAFWIQEDPFRVLLSPFMLSGTAQTASMFDVMAIATYLGVPSIAWSAPVGVLLFLAGAAFALRGGANVLATLSLLSMISLLWSYHWQYDYIVLIIPLAYGLKRWIDGDFGYADLGVGTAAIFIWFVQRLIDSASRRFPDEYMIVTLDRGVFWFTCLALYATLFSYMFAAKSKVR